MRVSFGQQPVRFIVYSCVSSSVSEWTFVPTCSFFVQFCCVFLEKTNFLIFLFFLFSDFSYVMLDPLSMPAVIPAPRVYIRFVVVKKLVVETRSKLFGELNGVGWHRPAMVGVGGVFCSFTVALLTKHRHRRKVVFLRLFTLKKLECSRQGVS